MIMARRILSLVILLAAAFQGAVMAFPLKVAGLDTIRTAVWIHDLRWGLDVVSANVDRSLVPASVMKSVTAASLLNLASSAERFATPVMAVGRITADSVLDGNIVVRVNGDPTIESQFFDSTRGFADSIAAGVCRLGIKRVKGSVIIDSSDFQDATTPPDGCPRTFRGHTGRACREPTSATTVSGCVSRPRRPCPMCPI